MYRIVRRISYATVVVAVVAGIVVLTEGSAWAAPTPAPDPAGPGQDPSTAQLVALIERARNWLMGIAFTVAAFFATWGALRRIGAGDDPTEIEKSKSAFRSAFIGAALVVLAPILVAILNSILRG
ncbi:pilin [Actinomycetes bacterium KLBMP 9797]